MTFKTGRGWRRNSVDRKEIHGLKAGHSDVEGWDQPRRLRKSSQGVKGEIQGGLLSWQLSEKCKSRVLWFIS